MADMVERVARALWEAEPDAWGWSPSERGISWERAIEVDAIGVTVFRTLASAAIEAMREPTEEMEIDGTNARMNTGLSTYNETPAMWRAMISAALREQNKEEKRSGE